MPLPEAHYLTDEQLDNEYERLTIGTSHGRKLTVAEKVELRSITYEQKSRQIREEFEVGLDGDRDY